VRLRSAITGLVLAGLVVAPTTASASCVAGTEDTPRFGDATVAVEGVALSGRTNNGRLISPARILVSQYLKGSGPTVARVATGTMENGAHAGVFGPAAGDSVRVVGDRGREDRSIFRGLPPDVIATHVCDPDTRVLRSARGPHGPAQDGLLLRARRAGALLGLAAG